MANIDFKEGKVVSNWLRETATESGFKTYSSLFGRFNFDDGIVEQSQGSVYGIWICCNEKVPIDLIEKTETIIRYNDKDYIPLYWGKDATPGNRTRTHFNASVSDDKLHLKKSKYKGLDLIFGVLYVSRYEKLEEFLINKYPALESDDYAKGGSTSIVKIMR